MEQVQLARVYDVPPPCGDGVFLVDRLWPRGISKRRLDGVVWLKAVAPSDALRRWFHANPQQWAEFVERYREELTATGAVQPLVDALRQSHRVVLLYASRETERNHAVVLRQFLLEQATVSDCE
ncbi:DUF488 domain-containing protein [Musicola paradisiaca]|uniref:DUF488 family protein n=1 Tax=Musicola paradisiaca (strain Ech703) TaxID=579405 RepID=C6CAD4_MUSP7|nr:DUF488 family protein [Musicola paradisiaca]ACS84609.1 protein of unknown function DUF488 [Musicola paradisiaca Ech703]